MRAGSKRYPARRDSSPMGNQLFGSGQFSPAEAGFKIADLLAAGASVKNLRTAGFNDTASVAALRKLRVEAWKMKLGGFSLSDLRNGGYSSAELRIAGFSSDSLAALEKFLCRDKRIWGFQGS
eukprot:s3098_g1.t1